MAITTLPQLKDFVAELMEGDEFAFDVETLPGRESRSKDPKKDIPALDPRTNNVFWISLAGRGVADAIPMGHPNGPRHLMRAEVFDHLAPLFFSDRRKIGQNVKFDLLSVAKYYGGDYPPPPYGDIGVLIHVLNENLGRGGGGYNLENFSKIYLGYSYTQLGEKGVQNFPFDEADVYSYLDVKVTWLIWRKMRKLLARQPNLERVFDLEMDVLEVLLSMQKHGALVERSEFDRLDRELSKRLKEKEQEVHEIIGRPLLLTSTLQKRNYIYNELGFRTKHKTGKGEQSVAERALEPIAHKHPAIQGFLDYTHLQKMHSTYVKGFIPYVDDDDRVRASFKQTGTVTGRFSCAEPNLQNIPRRDGRVEGALIRSLFVAPRGRVLVVADYSMIELRGIAHYCQDSNLLLAFRKGIDLHTLTASKLYKKTLEQVTKEQRQSAKNCNFCLGYGGGYKKLAITGKIDEDVAKVQAADWHATYPGVRRWTKQALTKAHRNGGITTIMGRKRRLPEINSLDPKLRGAAELQAINNLIQGSAADINKMAMTRIHNMFRGTDMFLTLTVHDELIAEVAEKDAERAVGYMKEAMENIEWNGKPILSVPLEAEIHYAERWSEAK